MTEPNQLWVADLTRILTGEGVFWPASMWVPEMGHLTRPADVPPTDSQVPSGVGRVVDLGRRAVGEGVGERPTESKV
jgi:hypothetical protein